MVLLSFQAVRLFTICHWSSLCSVALAAADVDLLRAKQLRPRSQFTGHDFSSIATQLNRHLKNIGAVTRPCQEHSLHELDAVARTLLASSDARLDSVYRAAADRRALRHSSAEGWVAESKEAEAAGSLVLRRALRDGKCAEVAMLWAHHVPAHARDAFIRTGLVLPLMSTEDHTHTLASSQDIGYSTTSSVYNNQTSCRFCHRSVGEEPVLSERHSITAEPPVWSPQFHVEFDEYTRLLWTARGERGSLHLDYPGLRMRWTHGKGQYNNWCQCAGLPKDEADAACNILSVRTNQDPAGGVYITFPELNKCCRLSDWDHGFGPIRPDWLTRPTNAEFLGQHQEGNRTCYMWSSHQHGNPLMTADQWSQDADGVPCSYVDKFSWWAASWSVHNLSFDPTTYSTEKETDEVFTIPEGMDCSRKCPNHYPWCFFSAGRMSPWQDVSDNAVTLV